MKEVFEEWVLGQFGRELKFLLEMEDGEGVYKDQCINSMWVGFIAGMKIGVRAIKVGKRVG